MTPIEHNDPLLIDQVSEILCRYNREEAAQLVGSVILPELQKKGIIFFRTSVNETTSASMSEPEPKMRYTDYGVQELGKSPQVHTFDIGIAMNLVKAGKKVARSGWNGKNMFVYYVPAGNWKAATQVANQVFGDTVPYNHYLAIKNPDGTVSTWAPSGSDALATDWYIVD